MKHVPAVLAILAALALGVVGVVYGGVDDSPGGQLIGVVIIVGAVVLGVKTVRTVQRGRKASAVTPDRRRKFTD